MNFKEWLLLEKTLYHGTIVDNEQSVRRVGLVGGLGDFIQQMHGDYPLEDEFVFATDKPQLNKALTAITFHIGKKLNKDMHDVTDNDIRNHGLLVTVEDDIEQRPVGDDWGEYPFGVEPGDYYADYMSPVKFIKGAALLRLLRRYGVWPRDWGPTSPKRTKQLKGLLIKLAIAAHPDKDKEDIISKVNSLTPQELEKYLRVYRR